jgi:muramoyltetrapeptide carboxypeptidase
MIVPAPLKPGDKIGIIAPSRKVSRDKVTEAANMIESWGYPVVFGENLFAEFNQFAGRDEDRAKDFMQMITNPEIKAILCARGGYGTVRLLDFIDQDIIQHNPKWIVGYSDITVLHSYINKLMEWETIHATMPVNYNPELASSDSWLKLKMILQGHKVEYELPAHELNRLGTANGMLVGGNLSLIFSLRGTFCDLDTDGRILFIEDLDEYLYHIDRMMMNLKISGKLKKLNGLIVGGMNEMRDNAITFGRSANEIIANTVKDYNYPVVFNFPAGHCEPNLPLILGRNIILDVKPKKVNLQFSN